MSAIVGRGAARVGRRRRVTGGVSLVGTGEAVVLPSGLFEADHHAIVDTTAQYRSVDEA